MAFETSEQPSLGFDALYRATSSDVFAYVASIVGDRTTAEDVTAAAFERAWRRRTSFDARRGSRRAWLFGIARNAALDELRRRRRTATLVGDPPDAAAPDPSAVDDEAAARRAAVAVALAGLDARERDLIGLRFHGGLTVPEIARVLGVSERAAAMRVHRAVTNLREACHV
ncbi:MAG TPA: sigma-70 family RNA polymerase sigma factor [Baekduia sp.]|nr:sigma-70 family RNA polymerase sigma factor [Baekduia sp.]